jgi:manganese/iron transport system ATP-binding protein
VEGVSVSYPNGHLALHDASFRLSAGTICALVGVNGSGKSTLSRASWASCTPTPGSVRINGGRCARSAQAKPVAYVPQSEEVDWQFPVSVWDVAMMGRYGAMNFLRIPRAPTSASVEESLRRVSMWEFRDRQIGELSGGQKKRVFLARALAQGGRIILLDEPFTGVDVKTEEAIIALLRELRESGAIILVSTHNLGSVPGILRPGRAHQPHGARLRPDRGGFHRAEPDPAFGGVLRQFQFEQSTIQEHDGRTIRVLTDDERPLVFGKDGHLEYKDRAGHEELLVKQREKAMNELLQSLLTPFQYDYMLRAIWVSALIGGVCGFLSAFVTLKGWSLMGDALSHAVVPGVAIAYILGLPFAREPLSPACWRPARWPSSARRAASARTPPSASSSPPSSRSGCCSSPCSRHGSI